MLANFSRRVDEILKDVNERFRIKFSDLHGSHVFDFSPFHDRIVRISEIVESSSTFDEFFDSLIDFMWELAFQGAQAAQRLINDALLIDVLHAIDTLEADVESLKGAAVGMIDLMNNIKAARSDFKACVELITNWFRFVGIGHDLALERLSVVVEAAVSSFESMFEHRGRQLIFVQEKSNSYLSYFEAKSLFISLFTALENALRHGADADPVTITHHVGADSDVVCITNRIRNDILNPDAMIAEIKAKWTDKYSVLSTAEGGSGVYKIFNLLRNASNGFAFDVSAKDRVFNATFGLKNEHFDNRRQSS